MAEEDRNNERHRPDAAVMNGAAAPPPTSAAPSSPARRGKKEPLGGAGAGLFDGLLVQKSPASSSSSSASYGPPSSPVSRGDNGAASDAPPPGSDTPKLSNSRRARAGRAAMLPLPVADGEPLSLSPPSSSSPRSRRQPGRSPPRGAGSAARAAAPPPMPPAPPLAAAADGGFPLPLDEEPASRPPLPPTAAAGDSAPRPPTDTTPVTDKLLGLLDDHHREEDGQAPASPKRGDDAGGASSPPPSPSRWGPASGSAAAATAGGTASPPRPHAPPPPALPELADGAKQADRPRENPPQEGGVEEAAAPAPAPPTASSSSYGGWFSGGGWFGASGAQADAADAPPKEEEEAAAAAAAAEPAPNAADKDGGRPGSAAADSKDKKDTNEAAAGAAVQDRNSHEAATSEAGAGPSAEAAAEEKEERAATDEPDAADAAAPSPERKGTIPPEPVPEDEARHDRSASGAAASAAGETATEEGEEEGTEGLPRAPASKPMSEADRRALDDAFRSASRHAGDEAIAAGPGEPEGLEQPRRRSAGQPPPRPRRGGPGRVHAGTPIPNADAALRILRRFAYRTQAKVPASHGGTKPRTLASYLFAQREDPALAPYRALAGAIFDDGEDREDPNRHELDADSESLSSSGRAVVGSILGESPGDTMARARGAVAAFVYLFGMWGHASSTLLDDGGGSRARRSAQEVFSELLSASLDAATQLVAHGCLDGVLIAMGGEGDDDDGDGDDDEGDNAGTNSRRREASSAEYYRAVHMLAQSVFNADLTIERNELSALKFLLTTGCRITPDGDAMLRGTHLLQAIRTLYHVYLTTESRSNKTTARASLQQLVTSVFTRLVQTDTTAPGNSSVPVQQADRGDGGIGGAFPSENHRDSFLVLRSICKLSMRSLPDGKSGRYSHVGLQTSGSNDTWDGGKTLRNGSDRGGASAKMGDASERSGSHAHPHEHAQLVYTAAIHPALESKLLALELLLYVLQHVEFSREFIQGCGPQFHAAIKNYLCVSLLKNCTSDDTRVVNLSLLIFVPLVRSFRAILKSEIEAFVTNVFFVILDSSNTPAEVKCLVVKTFDEICSDPSTLAEIFLNYDCDLSAVDLFHRIVNTLSKVSRTGLQEPKSSGMSFMGGASAARMEKHRIESRELRLNAMRALRQVLASLHASIVEPLPAPETSPAIFAPSLKTDADSDDGIDAASPRVADSKQNLVEIYDSKKRRRAEEAEVILRFNQKPSAGIAYATKCKHVDGEDPADVARYLLYHKDKFEKTQIGEYLGREPDYQNGFSLKVLHEYVRLMDFTDLLFDEAIRYFLSSFRLPGEAQKIDRIMEKFAERYTEQNPEVFPTADAAFILSFSIIMLNTDLHNPAIKEERRMTKPGFVRNNRGICDGQDLPEELLNSIFDRIKANPISLKEDDEARERIGTTKAGLPAALNPASFFTSHYDDMDRARESNFQKERDHIVRTTESLLRRRRHSTDPHGKQQAKTKAGKSPRTASKFVMTEDSGLRDEYVSPMFEVTWGPALAAFSTAMESANGTIGSLISIASDEELELAAENAAETIEVCLTGFRFAMCTAGLCGNDTARDAYMLALSRFTQLGSGCLLEARHVRCIQTMLSLAKDDGELLGSSWSHIFRALSEINRFHQLFHLMARNDRAAAVAAERRRRRLSEKERKRKEKVERKAAAEDGESIGEPVDDISEAEDSLAESDLFSDDDMLLEEDMDAKAIDEANSRSIYDAVSETLIEAIYERSASLSAQAAKAFVLQLCIVSSYEISVGGGDHKRDLNAVTYRQQHALLTSDQFHHSQPNIYNLQRLVEVTHYNMESRPRMIFAELWAIVSKHLTATALHQNPAIAMYAVDSFRQLSIQYLQRDELEVFEFQRRFLKPLEVVMARSMQPSTKELLLDCVDRIIHVFSSDERSSDASTRKGGLKSGWVPILSILGLGGRDENLEIATASHNILASELEHATASKSYPSVMLSDHFVETVDALVMHAKGPHDELSLKAMHEMSLLAAYLATETIVPPQLKRKASSAISAGSADAKQELELWWPILLGLSQSVGDSRFDIRSTGMHTLMSIINKYFLPPADGENRSKLNCDAQNLQLIFRGVLFPILEFAEFGSQECAAPSLPPDFQRFLTLPKTTTHHDEIVSDVPTVGWLETTFDPFMDACVSLCLSSSASFDNDSLVDEMFALLNACLLSDSGLLAVRGLHRLEQFVTSDLRSDAVSDDCWATVSHMLRRCLAVRDLPRPRDSAGSSLNEDDEVEYKQAVREFVAAESMLPDRRYIGANATMVIGMLLSTDRFAIGLRWKLFLIAGLGHAILQWEQAAEILAKNIVATDAGASTPPSYYETALYGRIWMNRFLLQLTSIQELVQAPPEGDVKANKFAAGQKLVVDETHRLLTAFLDRERAASQYRPAELDEILHKKLTGLVTELLSGLNQMSADHLKDMAWIDSVLLGTCIQSKNESIRLAVQRLVQRTAPTPNPYPIPPKPQPPKSPESPEEGSPPLGTASPEGAGAPMNGGSNDASGASEAEATPTLEDGAGVSGTVHVDEPEGEAYPDLSNPGTNASEQAVEGESGSSPALPPPDEPESQPGGPEGLAAGAEDDPLSGSDDSDPTPSSLPRVTSVPSDESAEVPAGGAPAPEPADAGPPAAESWNPMSRWFSSSSAASATPTPTTVAPPPTEEEPDQEVDLDLNERSPTADDKAVEQEAGAAEGGGYLSTKEDEEAAPSHEVAIPTEPADEDLTAVDRIVD